MPRRPTQPPEMRPTVQSVRLTAGTFDVICQMAMKRDMSVYAFLGGIIERVFEKQKIKQAGHSCYCEHQPSTLRSIVNPPKAEDSVRDSDTVALGRR